MLLLERGTAELYRTQSSIVSITEKGARRGIAKPSALRVRALATSECGDQEKSLQVLVRDNNVDQALRFLKKKLQQEGVFREMRLREHYEKPSEKRAREKAEGIRRAKKLAQKKLNRELGISTAKKPKPSSR